MEAILNGNGNQNIACLRGSFIDPLGLNIQDSLPSDQDTSHRKTLNAMDNDGSSDDNFDIDFSSGVVPGAEKSSRQRYDRDHVFGRVESWRGLSFAAQVEEENNIETRKRRRLASLPVIERLVEPYFYACGRSFYGIHVAGRAQPIFALPLANMLHAGRVFTDEIQSDIIARFLFPFSIVFRLLLIRGGLFAHGRSRSLRQYSLRPKHLAASKRCSRWLFKTFLCKTGKRFRTDWGILAKLTRKDGKVDLITIVMTDE